MGSVEHWWQTGETLPVVSTFIRDGSVGKVSRSWARASVLEYIIRHRISVPAYNIIIIHIWKVSLHCFVTDWWNVAAVSTFIKDGRVCDFHKFVQNCTFEKMWQNWTPLQCDDRVYQKCVCSTGKRQTKIQQQSQLVSRLLLQVSLIRSYHAW